MNLRIARYPLLAMAMLAGTAASAGDSPLQLSIAYQGHGQYLFEKQNYGYGTLLAAIRAEYGAQHIAGIDVDLADQTGLGDVLAICQLKRDTGAKVAIHFVVDGKKNDIYCS